MITRGCAGKILAVVTNASYLQTNDSEIFWLARDGVPMHTRGVICPYDENALRVGMSFLAHDLVLQIGERTTIDLCDARVWQPRTIAPSNIAPREVVNTRLSVIVRSVLSERDEATPALAFGASVPNLRFRDCFAETAHNDIAAIAEHSKALLGLGAGLTPAGDDFVGGALFAAYHLREAYTLIWDTQPIEDLLDWARPQTNRISYTILRDLARGQGPEPLHDLMFALLARDATADAAECAARLTRIGSSTGTEILAGALTGMGLIAD